MWKYLSLLICIVITEIAYAEVEVIESYFCDSFNTETFGCKDHALTDNTPIKIVAKKDMVLAFFAKIQTENPISIKHVWINKGINESPAEEFKLIAPTLTVNYSVLAGKDDVLIYQVQYEKKNPIILKLIYVGAKRYTPIILKGMKEIGKAVLVFIIAQPIIDRISSFFPDEKGVIETTPPIIKDQYNNQFKTYVTQFDVLKRKGNKTTSRKIIDPIAHKGFWSIFVVDEKNNIIQKLDFEII